MKNKSVKNLPESITWKALSSIPHQRNSAWYLIFGLVSLGLIIFGVYNKSILTVITFIAVIAAVLVLSSQQPREVAYKANKSGLLFGNTLYPYKIIKTFWIVYNPPQIKTLNFETTAYLNNRIVMQLGNQNPVELKLFLSQYLREDLERTESLTETLARNLKI
jgi:hypothetical protein